MNKKQISKDNILTSQGQAIWIKAISDLGRDASPKDAAPDELGCAETVSTIINSVFPDMPIILSTASLYNYLMKSDKFAEVGTPMAGDIIISPTGMGGMNGITNGHTGIIDNGDTIMSNNSATGNFLRNYTLASWTARYKKLGGYPICFFRRIA